MFHLLPLLYSPREGSFLGKAQKVAKQILATLIFTSQQELLHIIQGAHKLLPALSIEVMQKCSALISGK